MRKITGIIAASAAAIIASAAAIGTGVSSVKADGVTDDVITVVSPDDGKTFAVDNAEIDKYFKNYTSNYSTNFYGCDVYLTTPVSF